MAPPQDKIIIDTAKFKGGEQRKEHHCPMLNKRYHNTHKKIARNDKFWARAENDISAKRLIAAFID